MQLAFSFPPQMVTFESLKPIINAIQSNIAIVLPVGIAIFAILLGISLIPKIVKHFTRV